MPEAPVRRDDHGNKIDKMLEDAKDSAENEEERLKLEKFMMYSKGYVLLIFNVWRGFDKIWASAKILDFRIGIFLYVRL